MTTDRVVCRNTLNPTKENTMTNPVPMTVVAALEDRAEGLTWRYAFPGTNMTSRYSRVVAFEMFEIAGWSRVAAAAMLDAAEAVPTFAISIALSDDVSPIVEPMIVANHDEATCPACGVVVSACVCNATCPACDVVSGEGVAHR